MLYSQLVRTFILNGRPTGTAQLTLEGMDSPDAAKSRIQGWVNGKSIYRGANPLPNDFSDSERGTGGA